MSIPREYQIAAEVIQQAYQRGMTHEEVLNERYPGGKGGVGIAHGRARAATRQRIKEWLTPDYSDEPIYGGA